jgi:hypothetical protein
MMKMVCDACRKDIHKYQNLGSVVIDGKHGPMKVNVQAYDFNEQYRLDLCHDCRLAVVEALGKQLAAQEAEVEEFIYEFTKGGEQ